MGNRLLTGDALVGQVAVTRSNRGSAALHRWMAASSRCRFRFLILPNCGYTTRSWPVQLPKHKKPLIAPASPASAPVFVFR